MHIPPEHFIAAWQTLDLRDPDSFATGRTCDLDFSTHNCVGCRFHTKQSYYSCGLSYKYNSDLQSSLDNLKSIHPELFI